MFRLWRSFVFFGSVFRLWILDGFGVQRQSCAWPQNTTILNTALCRVHTGAVVSVPGEKKSAIVTAVLHAEGCCKRSLALSAKLSAELDGAKMLAACDEVMED